MAGPADREAAPPDRRADDGGQGRGDGPARFDGERDGERHCQRTGGRHCDCDGGHDDARPHQRRTNRRRLLTAGGAVAATALAGCSDYVPEEMVSLGGRDGTPRPTSDPHAPETDVVSFQYRRDGSTYEFIVGLEPPEGTGGANWWQVETLDGAQVVRKEFSEPRTGRRFTSSKEAELDDGTSAVVVRGHDVDSGYGGQVMLAHLHDVKIRLETQGHEKRSFADYSFDATPTS